MRRSAPVAPFASIALAALAAVAAMGACIACAHTPAASFDVASPASVALPAARRSDPTDTILTSSGELAVTPILHGTLLFEHDGKTVLVDPTGDANLDGLPPADIVLVTDVHPDHLDPGALARVKGPKTTLVGPAAVNEKVPMGVVLRNGESRTVAGIEIEAVAMYNLVRGPTPGKLFHEKGRGNGYVLTFGGKRVYVSGDTECTPEMRALTGIDVAFVCMNVPYTMSPAEAAACIKAFRPKVVVPYHYRGVNLNELRTALSSEKGIELRIRDFYPGSPPPPSPAASAAPTASAQPGTPPRAAAKEGATCGGIAGIACGAGLVCKTLGAPHPDQAGVCARP